MYPSQQNATDQTANFFWMLVIIFIAAIAFWYFEKKYVIAVVFAIRSFEMDLVLWFADGYMALHKYASFLPVPDTYHSLDWWRQFIAANPDDTKLSFNVILELSHDVGAWLRFPIAIILFVLASIIYTRHSTSRFIKSYSMKSLSHSEVENWPQITPVLDLDLAKQDIDKGPWAMAATPLDYCKRFDLAEPVVKDGQTVWSVKKAESSRQFILQIGPLWPGAERLPIHLQAMFVIFMARATGKRDMADKFISQISTSAGTGKLNFTGVKEAVAEFKNAKILGWFERHHAYTTTLMATLLEAARSDGVLATSEFIWLKPVDRRMWYMMNTVGRQTAVVEISGAYAHWLAERKLKRAMKTPMIKSAVSALEEAMANVLYVNKEDSWRSSAD